MRLIDADALKNLPFERLIHTDFGDTAIPIEEIDNAPTVDTTCPNCDSGYAQGYSDGYLKGKEERPQGEWIPTSERLPECMDNVLVTIQVDIRKPVVRSGYYAYGVFIMDNGNAWNWNDPEVKAWMPQPIPYEEAENETN